MVVSNSMLYSDVHFYLELNIILRELIVAKNQ